MKPDWVPDIQDNVKKLKQPFSLNNVAERIKRKMEQN